MTKKFALFVLATCTFLLLGACSKGEASDTGKQSETEGQTQNIKLDELINQIYEKQAVDFPVGEPTTIDLTDADTTKYFTGIEDGTQLTEAISSEAMIGSQAYSLVVARAKEDTDLDALKKEMLDGIDPRKWICVGADKVIVGNYQNILILIMSDSGLGATLTDDLYDAFTKVVPGKVGEKLERID